MTIGIICAMDEEIALLRQDMQAAETKQIAGRTFESGTLYGQNVVLVMSRIGKVATAITTTLLIEQFHVHEILFAGTAGGIGPNVHVGDVVIADQSVQHDFSVDSEPTFRVPLINQSYFPSDPTLTQKAKKAAERYFAEELDIPNEHLNEFGIKSPSVFVGTVASGDQFICDPAKKQWLLQHVENIQCVEMEGAAMAQVCYEYEIPYTIIRVISDSADHEAGFSFDSFIQNAARYVTRGCIRCLLSGMSADKA
jgi:adenosylhomocysteine nucleosidase